MLKETQSSNFSDSISPLNTTEGKRKEETLNFAENSQNFDAKWNDKEEEKFSNSKDDIIEQRITNNSKSFWKFEEDLEFVSSNMDFVYKFNDYFENKCNNVESSSYLNDFSIIYNNHVKMLHNKDGNSLDNKTKINYNTFLFNMVCLLGTTEIRYII